MTEHILDRIARELFSENRDVPESSTEPLKHDMKHPPGLVGRVTDYINSQCLYPREHLSVISAITAVGNIGGLNHKLDGGRITSNIFSFGIAGSGTGKESVIQAFNALHIEAGISGAVHGKIKSEQEIIRNLLRHQASYYNIDELGIFMRQLTASHKSGGASYLQGIIGMLMSAYSKASGHLLLSGDVKEEAQKSMFKDLAVFEKKVDEGIDCSQEIASLKQQIINLDKGLFNPFLSIIGFSTPTTFNESVSFEQVTSGFIGRSIIVNEPDTNPKAKRNFEYVDMPQDLKDEILMLRCNGDYDASNRRIEANGTYSIVNTTPEAKELLRDVLEWFWHEAEKHTERTGFEAVVRRGYEMVEKVSFILSLGTSERTLECVEWANEYIRRDIEYKTLLAYSNVKEKADPVESMAAKILCSIGEDGITVGRLVNKYRVKKSLVEEAIELLENKKKIVSEISQHRYDKKMIKTLYKA